MPTNHESWLNPLNKMTWQAAIKNRRTKMTLRDGRVFTIEYQTIPLFGEMQECIWVQEKDRIDGPCGWFSIKRVLDPIWLSVEEKDVVVSKQNLTNKPKTSITR